MPGTPGIETGIGGSAVGGGVNAVAVGVDGRAEMDKPAGRGAATVGEEMRMGAGAVPGGGGMGTAIGIGAGAPTGAGGGAERATATVPAGMSE